MYLGAYWILQALLANMAALYAVYHGPEGLKTIARRVNGLAAVLAEGAKKLGHAVPSAPFFDTVAIKVDKGDADKYVKLALYEKVRQGGGAGVRQGAGKSGVCVVCGRGEGGGRGGLWEEG